LAVLDFGNKVNEGDNADNNITAIPIKYERIGRKLPPKPCPPYCIELNNQGESPYHVDIYDFSGQKIQSAKVNNESEEQELINSLPSSLYIIKSSKEDKKISK